MTDSSPVDRAKANATEIASTVVTGVWLAALLLDFGWWLPLMLFGYVVVVPVVSMLFDEEEESADEADEINADALDRLRSRYDRGELTDEQFERLEDKLLETETPEDAAEWRKRGRERSLDRDRP
ncbi:MULTISPECIES: SHOCT domain-containing protein [Haloferacaceae]|uniref:SHOCT domain-containing protein n=1 Tax=Halorubrum glutamatedens TaxID=2707018 RepID=A0ABD5QTW6_9EURY|nr:SHOCT domain-containing protein [Halobellus captivus]